MPLEIASADRRYLLAVQDDGNVVVYDRGRPVWNRWTHEAGAGSDDGGNGTPDPALPEPGPGPTPSRPPSSLPIRVTDDRDGEVLNRIYSYWPNACLRDGYAWAFIGHADGQPRFFRVELTSGAVERLGPLLGYQGTGEGWYWDAEGWVSVLDGPRLHRANPFTGDDRLVFDISDTHPGCRLWQAHSSDDGRTHSATVQRIVQDGPYPHLGTLVVWQGEPQYFPAKGQLDESQITSDGAYLVIKEDHDNRVITLGTRETRRLRDADGAVGHSDCGAGFVVGEDDQHGACVLWDLRKPLTPGNRRELFSTWNMGHVSVRGGRCLLSDTTHLSLVGLDGSGVTPIVEHGMTGDGYDYQVHANLSPCGRVASYVSNAAGRMDLYLLPLPEVSR